MQDRLGRSSRFLTSLGDARRRHHCCPARRAPLPSVQTARETCSQGARPVTEPKRLAVAAVWQRARYRGATSTPRANTSITPRCTCARFETRVQATHARVNAGFLHHASAPLPHTQHHRTSTPWRTPPHLCRDVVGRQQLAVGVPAGRRAGGRQGRTLMLPASAAARRAHAPPCQWCARRSPSLPRHHPARHRARAPLTSATAWRPRARCGRPPRAPRRRSRARPPTGLRGVVAGRARWVGDAGGLEVGLTAALRINMMCRASPNPRAHGRCGPRRRRAKPRPPCNAPWRPAAGPSRTAVAEAQQEAQVLQAAALLDHDQVDQAVRQVAVAAGAHGRAGGGEAGRVPPGVRWRCRECAVSRAGVVERRAASSRHTPRAACIGRPGLPPPERTAPRPACSSRSGRA